MALQAVSQRPPMHRWLQQSTSVVQTSPGSMQIEAAHCDEKLHWLPAQQSRVVRQKTPAPRHDS